SSYQFIVQINTGIGYSDPITNPFLLDQIGQSLGFSLFGQTGTNNLPYTGFNCPALVAPDEYVELGNFVLTYDSLNNWVNASLTFQALPNLQTLIFGPSCYQTDLSPNDFFAIPFLMDNFELLALQTTIASPVELNIELVSDNCSEQTRLESTLYPNADYQWFFNGQAIASATEASIDFSSTLDNAGSYSVQVILANGNCGISTPFPIDFPSPLVFEIVQNPIACFGDQTGAITLDFQSNPTDLSFEWSDSNGQIISTQQNISEIGAGNYQLEITNLDGCPANYNFVLEAPTPLNLTAQTQDALCDAADQNGRITLTASGGNADYRFSIDGAVFVPENEFVVVPGSYTGTVIDANFCEATINGVTVQPPAELNVIIQGPEEDIPLGESFRLELLANRPTESLIVEWSPAAILDCADCLEVEGLITQTTTFEALVIDDQGCVAEVNWPVVIDQARPVYIPNAFSPNGDGINDQLEIYSGPAVRQILSFKVFNRWGALLQDNRAGVWDGRFKGQALDPGVYVWLAQIEFIDGQIQNYEGNVTLMK
ncbi:MAG: gliding motility-associated C-terminal domain-containing protein, partial [Bacteroidota bacterium]